MKNIHHRWFISINMLHHNLGLIGVIDCQTGFKLSSYWVKHVLYSVQSGSMMYYFYGKIHNYTVYKFVNWSFLAGTYLHTHILPVYHFVLYFLICCPSRGQNGIGAGDRNRGQGQYACTPIFSSAQKPS